MSVARWIGGRRPSSGRARFIHEMHLLFQSTAVPGKHNLEPSDYGHKAGNSSTRVLPELYCLAQVQALFRQLKESSSKVVTRLASPAWQIVREILQGFVRVTAPQASVSVNGIHICLAAQQLPSKISNEGRAKAD